MTIKKVEPKTRKVRVHEQRTYVDEEPVIEEEVADAEFSEPVTPIQGFLESIDDSRSLTMKVFLLPNFYKDGKRSIRANERPFVTQFPFSGEDIQDYQQRIQQACPAGGMFQIELREGFRILRVWEEPISPAPGYQAGTSTQQQQAYPIIVNPAVSPQPAPTADPMTIIERQAETFLKVAQVIKQLQPEQTHAITNGVDAPEPAPLRDRLLEGVILKMVESPKPDSLERVADLLTGGKESSWVETTLTAIGPHLGGFLKEIGAGVNALLLRVATGAPIAAPVAPQTATTSGVISEGQPAEEPAVDPAEYAWRRTLMRILDDMWEHVRAVDRGALGIRVESAAQAVADLAERFQDNEQITAVLGQLLSLPPEQVIDLCAMMVPASLQERVTGMKESKPAITWLTELQTEVKAILGEGGGEDAETTGS